MGGFVMPQVLEALQFYNWLYYYLESIVEMQLIPMVWVWDFLEIFIG